MADLRTVLAHAPARDRVGMGVQPLGGLRRPLVPAGRLRGGVGVLVMQRDRRRGRVLAALEGPRGGEMRLAPGRGGPSAA